MTTPLNISDQEILRIRQGLTDLGDAIFNLSRQAAPVPEIIDRSLSGNKIHGGKITKFHSVGIKDDSTRLVVLVNDDGIVTDNIDVETLVGDTHISGGLTVDGHITASSLHVNELVADIRQERSSPLEFIADEHNKIYGKGLLFTDNKKTRQITMQPGPDRFFVSDPIDLHREAYYSIGGLSVINSSELGAGITTSSLKTVGTLKNLKTAGDLTIDDYIVWNSTSMRLGIGTDEPNGVIGIVNDTSELVIDIRDNVAKIGTHTTSGIDIITDNTPRISIDATGRITIGSSSDSKTTVRGRLGINVNHPDVDIVTAGAVRFEGKLFTVSSSIPKTGFYNKGDIVWNSDPAPTGYIGWTCTREGSPGVWKPFGQISS